MFIEYFARNGHRVVRSSSLVPANDPTLLFTNAGMNQFKDVFLGLEHRDYKRAVTSQKCVRAGGKHNDLENVGRTARHHTFFEMLGNFSFGDYFKKDAVAFAWELVTKEWGMPAENLYVSVYADDDEAFDLWHKGVGIASERIARFEEDNFWAMGDTGPCGPCSEVFYDFGPEASDVGHADCAFPCECGRYVEIWNLVFMQFNRDASGAMTPLPRPSIDTGLGLERVAAALQGKISNYDTDLLRPLVEYASEISGRPYGENRETDISLRILADHSRASAFLVGDAVLPSNEGRGYVLRKIIRRALRHGRKLDVRDPFLFEMAGRVAEQMKEAYPELLDSMNRVATILKHEEERYDRTVSLAMDQFEKAYVVLPHSGGTGPRVAQVPVRDLNPQKHPVALADGQIVFLLDGGRTQKTVEYRRGYRGTLAPGVPFQLYDTYGMPLDFLHELAEERQIWVDDQEFAAELEKQRERAKASWKGVTRETANPIYTKLAETFRTETDFYYGMRARDCRIEAILTTDGQVAEIEPGTEAEVVLDRTVIYAEAGGQVADVGAFYDNDGTVEVAEVRGAYYPVAGLIAHRVVAKESLRVGDRVMAVADAARREKIRRNHTATHLMHAALRNILGAHVKQAGSLVGPDHLRFDFTHFTAVDADELHEIEQQVNAHILRNLEMQTDILSIDDALASGALAFFGDKYPESNVRVLTVPDPESPQGFFSRELCGGTHVRRTGDIGVFKIVAEQSVAAGIRRIEAITGERALAQYQKALETLRNLAGMLNVGEDDVAPAVERLAQSARQLEKQLEALKKKATHSKVDDLLEQARTVKDVRVVSAQVEDIDRAGMRQLVDTLRQKLGSGVVVLGTTENEKVALIAAVTKDLTGRLHAGKIVQAVAQHVGGTGGGRADLAEAGGKDTSALEKAIAQVHEIVERML
jgi:alanyl-tRNA synthetase